jgi:hypothetical protein
MASFIQVASAACRSRSECTSAQVAATTTIMGKHISQQVQVTNPKEPTSQRQLTG